MIITHTMAFNVIESKIMKQIMLLDGGMGQELVKRNASTNDPLWSARVLLDNFKFAIKK